MKKLLPLAIVGVLIISGLVGAAGLSEEKNTGNLQTKNISFSQPLLNEQNGYITLKINGANNEIIESGNPMMPIYITSFMFSWNAKIKGVTCSFSNVKEMAIDKKIIPVAETIIISDEYSAQNPVIKENIDVYESNELFPDSWYTYSITCGVNSLNQ